MTSLHGTTLHSTHPLWGESLRTRGFPSQRAGPAEFWCFCCYIKQAVEEIPQFPVIGDASNSYIVCVMMVFCWCQMHGYLNQNKLFKFILRYLQNNFLYVSNAFKFLLVIFYDADMLFLKLYHPNCIWIQNYKLHLNSWQVLPQRSHFPVSHAYYYTMML